MFNTHRPIVADTSKGGASRVSESRFFSRVTIVLTILAALTWVIMLLWQVSTVLHRGRGSYDLGYDDVVYALVGKRTVAEVVERGFLQALTEWVASPPHAPFLEAYSISVQAIFGPDQQALYLSLSVLLALGSFAFGYAIGTTWLIRFAVAAVVAASPLGYLTANEFRPDVFYVLAAMCAIAFTARAALNSVPAREASRFMPPVCVGVMLLFLKPPWILLTVGIFLGMLSAIVIYGFGVAMSSRPGERTACFMVTLWKVIHRPLLLVAFVGVAWIFWLGTSTYDYLFGARDHPYFFAASPTGALQETYESTMVYLGTSAVPAIYFAISASVVLAGFLVVRCRLGGRQAIDLALLTTPIVSVAFVVAATAAAEHPSPFQGIYIYGVIAASVATSLGYLALRGARILPTHLRRAATLLAGIVLLASVGLFVHSGAPTRGIPPMFADPFRAETRVAHAITEACPRPMRVASANDSSREVSVLVAPIEDMSWEGVAYYLPDESTSGSGFFVTAPDSMTANPATLIALAKQFDFVVVRSTNYVANRIPSNMLLQDLHEALLNDSTYRQLPAGLPDDSYSVFARQSACGPRS